VSQEGAGPELKAVPWHAVRRAPPAAPAVVALGNFDGVHLGHARILDSLVAESRAAGLDPVLVTFEPHPKHYFRPKEPQSLLATPAEKLALLRRWPVEVIPLAFDKDLAGLEAEAFIQDFLLDRIRGRRFLLGHDHRFGRGARGDAKSLRAFVADPERDVILAEALIHDGEVVSSSGIRAWLEAGRVDRAATLLGRPYSYSGQVVAGERRGRTLGFPTANLDTGFALKAPVARGVYGGLVALEGHELPAVANIGVSPTFDGMVSRIEVHLIDFDGDLYGRRLEFKLRFQVRPEIRFPSVEALKAQIATDVDFTRERLASLPR
jgi:riboflavin kinase/FMN adenylyltransferase